MPSYLAESWAQLAGRLRARGIGPGELRRAQRALAGPDPAGVMGPIRRSDVALVAVHMNPRSRMYTQWSPLWAVIVEGLPPARAIFYHEPVEIAELSRLGETDPDALERKGAEYAGAHAWACWAEARYWYAWAEAEDQTIGTEAFLFAHPWRPVREVRDVAALLVNQGLSVNSPSTVEWGRARSFYRAHGVEVR